MNRYTMRLLGELIGTGEADLTLFTDRPVHPMFRGGFSSRDICFTSRREVSGEQRSLPCWLRKRQIDVFHAPSNPGLPRRPAAT
jgi:hypothetical protein